jgi:hypothetical protein
VTGARDPGPRPPRVDPEHHVGVEHLDQPVEAAFARGRKKRVDELTLCLEVRILRGRV